MQKSYVLVFVFVAVVLIGGLYYGLYYLPQRTAQQELQIQQDHADATSTVVASGMQTQQAGVDATSTAIAIVNQDQQNQQAEADLTATASVISWEQTFDALWSETDTSCFVGIGYYDAVVEFRGPYAKRACIEFARSQSDYSQKKTPNVDPSYLSNLCYGLYYTSTDVASAFTVYDDGGRYYGTAMCRQLGVTM